MKLAFHEKRRLKAPRRLTVFQLAVYSSHCTNSIPEYILAKKLELISPTIQFSRNDFPNINSLNYSLGVNGLQFVLVESDDRTHDIYGNVSQRSAGSSLSARGANHELTE